MVTRSNESSLALVTLAHIRVLWTRCPQASEEDNAMRKRFALAVMTAAMASAILAGPAAASNASCTAQFTSALAPVLVPFGQSVVVPEVRSLSLGGRNVGQEVKFLLATADRNACPVAP